MNFMDNSSLEKKITLSEIIAYQSQPNGWVCEECLHYKGNLKCKKNIFISFVGCYTKDCVYFEKQEKNLK